jgi:hypothetical protein
MGKLKLSSEEREQILESHNKYRDILMGHLFDTTLVSEQATPNMPAKQLFALAKQNCAKDGPIASAQPGTHLGKDVLVYKPTAAKEGVWDQGDEVYFYADGTYIVVGKENRVKGVRQWNCPNLPFERNRTDNLIDTLTRDYKYFLYNSLPQGYQVPAEQKDQSVLDIIQVGNTFLYRPKTSVRTPVSQTEKDIIDTYLKSTYGLNPETMQGFWTLEPTEAEKQKFISLILPRSAGLSQNYQIWLDMSKIPLNLRNKFNQTKIKEDQKNYNKRACAKSILDYYRFWKEINTELLYSDLEIQKQTVKKCLAMYQNENWGLLGVGGQNVEKAIKAIYGNYTGDNKFPPMSRSGRDKERPVVRQVKTADGEKTVSFDFRLFEN